MNTTLISCILEPESITLSGELKVQSRQLGVVLFTCCRIQFVFALSAFLEEMFLRRTMSPTLNLVYVVNSLAESCNDLITENLFG